VQVGGDVDAAAGGDHRQPVGFEQQTLRPTISRMQNA